MVDAEHCQDAMYKIECSDCKQCYIGETKRWFVTRKKEHMRDVRLMKWDSTVLSRHTIQSEHEIDWKNFVILDLKMITLNENLLNHFSLIRKVVV